MLVQIGLTFLLAVTIPSIEGTGNKRVSRASPSVAYVADLMVVCDKEFSDTFQQDRQKIMDYWRWYLWDINTKFQTLPTVNLSFRLIQLIIIKDFSDQTFVETAKTTNGSVSLLQSLHKFAEWVYTNEGNFRSFDIAVLITGAATNDTTDFYTYIKAACKKNTSAKRHYSTVALRQMSAWGYSCGQLENALATLLGAPYDKDTSFYDDCNTHEYIMNSKSCGNRHYFFSKCSDNGISKYIDSRDASCIRDTNSGSTDVLNTQSIASYPPSLDVQCSLITSNSHAVSINDDNKCFITTCTTPDGGNITLSTYLHPLDNTPCDTEKFCFRGRCLPRGFQLRNMGSGKCLHSVNRFSSNDFPAITTCTHSSAATPLDRFMVLDKGPAGKLLATPYSTIDGNDNEEKCISVDFHEEKLQYQRCNTTEMVWIVWDFKEIILKTRREFLLVHRKTKKCVGIFPNSTIKLTETCNGNDIWMRWSFHERYEAPDKWFQADTRESSTALPFIMPYMPTYSKAGVESAQYVSTPPVTDYARPPKSGETTSTNSTTKSISDEIDSSTGTTEYNDQKYSSSTTVSHFNFWGVAFLFLLIGGIFGSLVLIGVQHIIKRRSVAVAAGYQPQCAVLYSQVENVLDLNYISK